MAADDLCHKRVDRKPVTGISDRRLSHLAEAHGAEAFERRDPGVGSCRHYRAHDALRDFTAVVLLEEVAVKCLGPSAKTGDGDDAVDSSRIDDDRSHACDIHEFRLHHAERNARGNPCINRVAARFQNFEPGFRRKILSRGNHVACAHDGWAMRFHAVLRPAAIGMECTVLPSLVPRILNARIAIVCPARIETHERFSTKHRANQIAASWEEKAIRQGAADRLLQA